MQFLSKNLQDEYVGMLATSHNHDVVGYHVFDYDASTDPLVLRGILKHKLIKRCWADNRDFYYIDSGYFGNSKYNKNPLGNKLYHRIVKNDLQHGAVVEIPADRWLKLGLTLSNWRNTGRNILVAAPDEKPCKFYGVDKDTWIAETVATIKQHTDRPVVVRDRAKLRSERITNTLQEALSDTFALVTFNSVAATEAIMYGIPTFTLVNNAASPVSLQDLSKIETPYYPTMDERYAWACHLAYGQFHVTELKDGSALRILGL